MSCQLVTEEELKQEEQRVLDLVNNRIRLNLSNSILVNLPSCLVNPTFINSLLKTFPPVWKPKFMSYVTNQVRIISGQKLLIEMEVFMMVSIEDRGEIKYYLGTHCFDFQTKTWQRLK